MTRNKPLNIINLGAGVQSTVMLLMSLRGELGDWKPDAAIFADTQWEPKSVYEHLWWLVGEANRINPEFKIYVVTNGNLREKVLRRAREGKYIPIPAYRSGGAPGSRDCTVDFKIRPIERLAKKLAGITRKNVDYVAVRTWLGISVDEIRRMKKSTVAWNELVYPLIELGIRRSDCEAWFRKNYPDRPLAKSSCIGCPYHSDNEWRRIVEMGEIEDAYEVDDAIRQGDQPRYLHRSLKPLREVVEGRLLKQGSLFDSSDDVCGGYCWT